ncbi:MAG: aldehyde dehydrogenase family protein [Opitutales bacterium]
MTTAVEVPFLPALRYGRPYYSLDQTELRAIGSEAPLARIGQINPGLLRRDILEARTMREGLVDLASSDLVEMIRRAGERFLTGDVTLAPELPPQSADEFVRVLSASTGLPHALCRANMDKVALVCRNLERVLQGLTRGLDLSLFDQGVVEQQGIPVCFFSTADSLGVVLPSNSPGVNSLWIPALAMKIPVFLKPGREDPWTPLRLAQAFIQEGVPRELVSFYPAGHEGGETLLQTCGRGIVFGGDATVERYAGNPAIQTHGTGRSKIILGEDMADRWEEFIDVMADSIARNSGRSCINASCILTPRHGDAIAEALAERLAKIEPLPLDHPDAALSGFANPAMAEGIEAIIENGLKEPGAEDITAKFRTGQRLERDANGLYYIRPMVVRCDSIEHPLGNTEFLFPYSSVVEMPASEMTAKMGFSLVVTALTEDERWMRSLMACPDVDRLNIGAVPTCVVEWEQPHEGNLFEFLFQRRAIQRGAERPA